MRLWHYKLLPFLPKSQILSQWRELNSIYAKQDKHILINFIYEYDREELLIYSMLVMKELRLRKVNIKSYDKFDNYFESCRPMFAYDFSKYNLFYKYMNNEYIEICYFNLKEKYIRGQKDFTEEQFKNIERIYKESK